MFDWYSITDLYGSITKMRQSKHFGSMIIICLLSVLLAGCAQVRKVTYPRDFVYLDQSLVQTAMQRMSLAIRNIDQIMIRGEPVSPVDQQRIRQSLATIDEVSDSLGPGNLQTNHLLIDEHIDDFKREVRNAVRTANATPPSFYPAARLSASCFGCHRYRH